MTEEFQGLTLDHREPEKILLIDLENCPAQIHQLRENLDNFSKVVICYAQTGAKIPLDWLIPLSATVHSNRLKIHKMTSGGKNSADFGISFFAGMLMQQFQKDAHFVIVSNDSDLDHVVNLLKSQGRSAERVGTPKQEQKNPGNSAQDFTLASLLKTYCKHLITYQKNRPARQETLLNSIKNKFKDQPEVTADILKRLTTQGAVNLSENRVVYNDKIIKKIATQP
ncbi:MAG: PIN domain-containing protein [Spirulinaceae cyanobacterium]